MKRAIILANGQVPGKSLVHYFSGTGYQTIVCADGGANSAFRLGIFPDIIIGDFDSAKPSVLEHFRKTSEIIHMEGQDDTDMEKALKLLICRGFGEAILLGATGDRLDHSYFNLLCCLKYHDRINLKMIHGKSVLEVIEGSISLRTSPGEIISLYGFDSETTLSSHGLSYELKGISLPPGLRDSTSNSARATEVSLEVKGGKMFLIRELKALKKNGYFKQG